jgi:hypothetical protein
MKTKQKKTKQKNAGTSGVARDSEGRTLDEAIAAFQHQQENPAAHRLSRELWAVPHPYGREMVRILEGADALVELLLTMLDDSRGLLPVRMTLVSRRARRLRIIATSIEDIAHGLRQAAHDLEASARPMARSRKPTEGKASHG